MVGQKTLSSHKGFFPILGKEMGIVLASPLYEGTIRSQGAPEDVGKTEHRHLASYPQHQAWCWHIKRAINIGIKCD